MSGEAGGAEYMSSISRHTSTTPATAAGSARRPYDALPGVAINQTGESPSRPSTFLFFVELNSGFKPSTAQPADRPP